MKKLSVLAGAASLAAALCLQAQNNPQTPQQRTPAARGPALQLAIEAAQTALELCHQTGGQKIAASVVDSAGVLKVLLAFDGASTRGVNSSTAKAITALKFKTDTKTLHERLPKDTELAKALAKDSKLNARPGGIVLKVGEDIVGAIGIGGGRTDHDCAVAGLEKIHSRLR